MVSSGYTSSKGIFVWRACWHRTAGSGVDVDAARLVTRRAKHPAPRQPLPAKIFHFTEIRNCGIHRRSPARRRGAVRESFETRAGLRWTQQRRHERCGQGG
jgi:hypothetical protein